MVFCLGEEKLRFDENFNPYFIRTISKDGKTEKIQPEQCTLPLVKELTAFVVLRREGFSPSMEKRVWYGLQQIQIKVPNEKEYRYHYICYDARAMSNVCVVILNPTLKDSCGNYNKTAWDMSLNPKKMEDASYEWEFIRFIGKAKPISAGKLAELKQNKQILAVLNDSGMERCELS